MRHRKLAVNGTLVAATAVLATLGYLTVAGTGGAAPAGARTAAVTRGDVTAAVSASGNITSAMTLGTSFTDCTGPLTAIDVKPGQVVSAGQVLATVDSGKAQTAMTNAQAQLAAVQSADYTGGATVGDALLDSLPGGTALPVRPAVYSSAPTAAGSGSGSGPLSADEAGLLNAQNTYKADQLPTSAVNRAVGTAAATVKADTAALAQARQVLAADQQGSPPDPVKVRADQAAVVQAEHQLVTDEAGYNSAEQQLTQTLAFDQQSIVYWQAELTYDKGQGPAPATPTPATQQGATAGSGAAGASGSGAGGAGAGNKPSSPTAATPGSGATVGGSAGRSPGAAGTTTTPSAGGSSAASTGGNSPTSTSKTSGGGTSAGTSGGSGSGATAAPSQTALNNAQEAVAAAQQTLADCTLTAPVAGTVVTVNGVVGALPASSAGGSASANASTTGGSGSGGTGSGGSGSGGSGSSGGGSSSSGGSGSAGSNGATASTTSGTGGFITLADLTQLQIKGAFSESDVNNVQAGQQANVVFPALTDPDDPAGITATGTVTSVDLSSVVSNNVVTYGVLVSLSDPPPRIKLGETGNVTVTTASQTGVLTVPTNAVTALGATKTVTVQDGNTTRVVPVQVGIAGNGLTEITSGVGEGQKVVLPSATSSSTGSGGFPRIGGGGGGGGGTGGLGGRLGGGS